MNEMLSVVLVFFLVWLAAAACAADSSALDWPKDFFPIMPWDSLNRCGDVPADREAGIRSIAECNFTLSAYATPADLPVIEKFGLKAIVHSTAADAPWKGRKTEASPEAVDESVRLWVESYGESRAVAAYYVTDEPNVREFAVLGATVEAIKKHAPGKLAYINLFPGYATIGAADKSQLGTASYEEYLERFVEEVKPQVLSYDDYMVQYSDDFRNDAKAAIYFKDLLTVRQVALKHGMPFWNTVASNQIRPHFTVPSPANLLIQAYTTLAAGGRGICWYTYFQGGYAYAPVDKSGRRTTTWNYLRMVNAEVRTLGPIMNRLNSTGVFFSKPWPTEQMPQLPGRIVECITARSSTSDPEAPEPEMMVGEFTGEDGADYVMVVNLSLERSANFVLKTRQEYARKEAVSAVDGSLSPLDEERGHWVVAGGGALVKLSEL